MKLQMTSPLVELDYHIITDELKDETAMSWVDKHENVKLVSGDVINGEKMRDCVVLDKVLYV